MTKITFTSPLPLDHQTGPSTPLSYIKDALVESDHDVTIIDRTCYDEFKYDVGSVGRGTAFDLRASYDIEDCDLFIGSAGSCLLQMQKLRNAKKITLWFSSHYNFASKILEEEYKKFGIKGPAIHPYEIFKAQKEHEMSDYLVVPSRQCAQTYIDNGIPDNKLLIVPFGVDITRFYPDDKKEISTLPKFLFAGGNWIRKGLTYLLLAAMNMKKEPHLTIIGCVPNPRTNLKKLHIEGWVPDDKVPKIYRRSDVFVLPSLEEGSALVVYEAMASGLPCIVTPECGSMISNGKDGIIVEPRNIEQLKDAMQYFIDNPEEVKRMGSNARSKVEREYTWDHFKNRFIKILEEI